MALSYLTATTEKDFNDARDLFVRYSESLDIDLSFQNFGEELENLKTQYGKPSGSLLLCYDGAVPVACVALRRLEPNIGELKRMYVDPLYRGQQIGHALLLKILDIARALGYLRIRLDTLPTMQVALKLYRTFGFYEIEPYRFNPIDGTVYMECKL